MLPPVLCSFDGCGRLAPAKRQLCWGHQKQRRLGKPLTPLRPWGRTLREYLKDSATRFADADGDEEYEKACAALRMASIRYARKRR